MLPLSDVIPARAAPRATLAIILVTAVLFGAQAFFDPALVPQFGLIPTAVSVHAVLTYVFVQDSAWHAAFSLLYVWIFGATLEDRLGRWAFVAVYLGTGAAAAIIHARFEPTSPVPVVGPSGAVVGLLGAYFVNYPQSKVLTLTPVPPFVAEVPAVFFLACWWTVELVVRVERITGPAVTDASTVPVLWALVGAGALGGLAGRLLRRPERWGP